MKTFCALAFVASASVAMCQGVVGGGGGMNPIQPATTNYISTTVTNAIYVGGLKALSFTTSGGTNYWTNTVGAVSAFVQIWGGGGSGTSVGTAGGGGAYCAGLVTLTNNQILSAVIGTNGVATKFSAWVANPGVDDTAAGGVASNATVNINGGYGIVNVLGGASPRGGGMTSTSTGIAPGGGSQASGIGANGGWQIEAY